MRFVSDRDTVFTKEDELKYAITKVQKLESEKEQLKDTLTDVLDIITNGGRTSSYAMWKQYRPSISEEKVLSWCKTIGYELHNNG